MDREKNLFRRVARSRWLLPLGFAGLVILSLTGVLLLYLYGLENLPREYVFNVAVDIVGICVCCVLFYGCMTGSDSTQPVTYLFVALLTCNGVALFLDECVCLVQGEPDMIGVNTAVHVLYYANGLTLIYQFWRYLRTTLEFKGKLVRSAGVCVEIMLIPAVLACFANFFYPLYFLVDELGVYQRTPMFPLYYVYLLLVMVFLVLALATSDTTWRQKRIAVSFITLPLVNVLLTFQAYYISTQFVATLIAIVLMYSALFAERSKSLAATETELQVATHIQAHMLPNTFPAFPDRVEFDIYASMDPAREVGGDFYDFFMPDDDHLVMVMGDVSGKGVPAALFMMTSRTMLKDAAQAGLDPAQILTRVNGQLCENNQDCMFVTVWVGVLEISTGTLTWADAGHEVLLVGRGNAWSFQQGHKGPALAGFEPEILELEEEPPFANQVLQLQPGDVILQYTDGVTEAVNGKREQFGSQRLLRCLDRTEPGDMESLLGQVRRSLDEFVQGEDQFDDVTMLALRYAGPARQQ